MTLRDGIPSRYFGKNSATDFFMIQSLRSWKIDIFNTGIFTKIARAILVKIPIEMCRITSISMTHLNVSFVLQNISQCAA